MKKQSSIKGGRTNQLGGIQPMLHDASFGTSRLCDCCVLILHCDAHNQIALYNTVNSDSQQTYRWFPYLHILPKSTWHHILMSTIFLILGQNVKKNYFTVMSCLNLFRLQLPRTQHFITRMIYYVRLNSKLIDPCLANTNKDKQINVEWVPVPDILKNQVTNLWGPEVNHYVQIIDKRLPIKQSIVEYSVKEAFSVFPIREAPQNREEEMLLESKVSEKDVERFYDDYIDHCFPCFFMNFSSFKAYMTRHNIETNEHKLGLYFNAFRFLEKPYMSFHELLIGLVAIDRETVHCETRLKIIFRFYDQDLDGYLNRTEFSNLVQDISMKKGEQIEEKVDNLLAQMKKLGVKKKSKAKSKSTTSLLSENKIQIGFKTFFEAVKCKILVGTSKTCRSQVWICATIARNLITRRIQQTFSKSYSFRRVVVPDRKERCLSCVLRNQKEPYRIAVNMVWLTDKKQFFNAHRLHKVDKKRETTFAHSIELQFNSSSLPNLYMMLIRTFSKKKIKGTISNYKGLFEMVPENLRGQFVVDIEWICHKMEQILESELRITEVSSPAFLIGDIHGNLEDLMTLETCLWPSVPFIQGNRFVFLGDYVDRGKWGFECAIYLFCFKLLAPNMVTLLRGNHEVRSVQKSYSYEQELTKKYGKHGHRFYEITNRVFDRLQCGAIVDDSVFCAHGGIPFSAVNKPMRTVAQTLSTIVPEPEYEDPCMIWEIVWSDPAENKYLREEYEFLTDNKLAVSDEMMDQIYQLGYLPNRKRGTGFLFNEYAFGVFLILNGFSHMVRAHEVPQEGYRLNFRSRCITIFSCSHYCGVDNECAVAMLLDNRVRIIQLDTFFNSSATD